MALTNADPIDPDPRDLLAAFDANYMENSKGPASYKLIVLSLEKVVFPSNPSALSVYVNPEEPFLGLCSSSACLLQRKGGSDCILRTRSDGRVPIGCVAMSEAQRINMRMAEHELYSFEPFDWRPWRLETGFQFLTEVTLEVCLMPGPAQAVTSSSGGDGSASNGTPVAESGIRGLATSAEASAYNGDDVHIAMGRIQAAVRDRTAGHVLCAKQRLTLQVDGHLLLLRVLEVHNLGEAERDAQVVYHCYRGVVGPDTRICVEEWEADASSALGPSQPGHVPDAELAAEEVEGSSRRRRRGTARLVVDGAEPRGRKRVAKVLPNIVNVTTSDEEWFPVKKALLRPCIALTKHVQDSSVEAPSVTIDVECNVFDRVLLFLEHLAKGRAQDFDFDINLTEDMMRAAQVLGLGALVDVCQQKQGSFDSRIREYTYEEVLAANRAGNVWLIIDGAIFDVTRWLPEHPGGSTIIPRQALNIDCARFFELYHSSRESFMYLKEFYLGEIRPEDRPMVPSQAQPPSADFLDQLREHTEFRLNAAVRPCW